MIAVEITDVRVAQELRGLDQPLPILRELYADVTTEIASEDTTADTCEELFGLANEIEELIARVELGMDTDGRETNIFTVFTRK